MPGKMHVFRFSESLQGNTVSLSTYQRLQNASGDTVASLLVSQSVQNLVVEMKTEFSKSLAELKEASAAHVLLTG